MTLKRGDRAREGGRTAVLNGCSGLAGQATLKLRGEKSYRVGIGEEASGWREQPVQRDMVGLVCSRSSKEASVCSSGEGS